jgi:hypothetical protein
MKTISTIAASLSIVGAFYLSAPPAYAGPVEDGYRLASLYEKTKMACEVYADNVMSGRIANVTPSPGSGIGILIFGPMAHAHVYDQCMALSGYIKNN